MKKIRCKTLIILLCVMFVFQQFTYQTTAIEQHEVADGTAIGYIENETVYEGYEFSAYSSQDVTLQRGNPNSNYNSDNLLRVYNNTYAQSIRTRFLLEFNVSSFVPAEATIIQATVYLYAYSANIEYDVYAYRVVETWDETTVTWNAMPSYNSTYSAVETAVEGTWNTWDVTTDIQHFMDSNYTNYGWLFKRPVSSNSPDYTVTFKGKPSSGVTYDPYISIEYAFPFNVTRDVLTNTESNNINFSCFGNYSDDVNLKIPVSDNVRGIIDVTNNTGDTLATEVNNTADLVNGSYWYDSANQYVYIRTINLTYGMIVNWTVNCSYGVTFNIPIPTYKEVGDDIIMSGRILNFTGVAMNISAFTHIYNSTGADVITPVHEWFCHYGNYYASIPTSGLIPGIYSISIEIVDPDSGITFKYGDVLYLSFETPDGVYSDALVYFSFYNTNVGLGLIPETFKVYVDDVRNYEYRYYGYTGQTINITVRDYYNFIMRADEVLITETYTGLNYGLTFHEYHFTNENSEAFYASFLKDGASLWYEKVVPCSGGQNSFMLPTGNYTVRVYNADNSSYVSWNDIVNRSKAHLIGTDGVTLIIEGLSTIDGHLLEFNQDLNYALMPDVVRIVRNPPTIYSIFDKLGQIIGNVGNQTLMICPLQIVWATTINETVTNSTTSYPLIPANTIQNGTIVIKEDVMYFAGPTGTVVNITNADNGSGISNTSYVPNKITLFGENVTISATNDITITRETRYQASKKFDWGWRTYTDYSTATINVSNPLDTVLRLVYVYAEYHNRSKPNEETITVKDIDNDILLPYGEQYSADKTGIHFQVEGSIPANTYRLYSLSYYGVNATASYAGHATTMVEDFNVVNKNGKAYNHFQAGWTNTRGVTYKGPLKIIMNFTEVNNILTEKTLVYDHDNNLKINRMDYSFGEDNIEINPSIIGDVLPSSGRTFDVYFLLEQTTEMGPTEFNLNSIVLNIEIGEILLSITWAIIFCCIFFVLSIPCFIRQTKFSMGLGAMFVFMIFMIIVLSFA